MNVPVPKAGQYGLVPDQPHNELPLNAWTDARNIRFRAGAAEKFGGHQQVFGNMLFAPEFIAPFTVGGTVFWTYASALNIGTTDGANHADITRAAGPYTANPLIGWTATALERIPIFNNGVEVPQMWLNPGLPTKLVDLTNWPANVRVNTFTSMKRYGVALDVIKSGVRIPTMIKWSHKAPDGGVPLSWDETNSGNDAGEWVLPDDGGYLVDAVPLRDDLMLYREGEAWLMRFVGGAQVFSFTRVLKTVGAVARKNAVEFFSGKHAVFTGDDVVAHDGHQAESLVTERIADYLRNNIDLTNYNRSFVCTNFNNKEVWVCIPEPGQTFCTKALVWNWTLNIWGIRDLPNVGYADSGIVTEIAAGETWDGAVGIWDTDNVAWRDRTSDPTKRRLLMGGIGPNKLLIPGVSNQFAGADMQVFLERRGLGFPVTQDGPPDYTRMKQVLSIWPRISGTQGGIVKISLGRQEKIDGVITWDAFDSYVIGSSQFCDFSGSAASRIHALRFESDTNIVWKLYGYDADVIDRGAF